MTNSRCIQPSSLLRHLMSALLVAAALSIPRSASASLSNLQGSTLFTPASGGGLSACLQAEDRPAMAFTDTATHALTYAYFDGAQWKHQLVDQTLTSSSDTAIVCGGANGTRIFYYDQGRKLLKHAERSGETWRIETVESSRPVSGEVAAADCGSSVCVSYYDAQALDLRFAKGRFGSWSKSTIDGSGRDVGSMSDLAVTGVNEPVIAYYDRTAGGVRVAERTSSGSWKVQALPASFTNVGHRPRIAVGSDNGLHVVFARGKSEITPHDTGLYYARRTGSTWSMGLITDDYAGGEPDLVLKDGLPMVSYRYLRFSKTSGNFAGIMIAALTPSGVWQTAMLEPEDGGAGARYYLAETALLQSSPANSPIVSYHYRAAGGTTPVEDGIRLHTAAPSPLLSSAAPATPAPQPTQPTTPAPTQTAVATPPASGAIRINAGGKTPYTDTAGNLWLADVHFVSGGTYQTSAGIDLTNDDPLYATERFQSGTALEYRVPVANGTYDVTLHFAEIYFGSAKARVFDVFAEGSRRLDDLDIYASAGRNKPLKKVISGVTVGDGRLDLSFQGSINNAKVSAIEIIPRVEAQPTPMPQPTPAPTAAPTPSTGGPAVVETIRINAGASQAYTDAAGNLWSADRSFLSGKAYQTGAGIDGTVDDPIYATERFQSGSALVYRIPATAGTYNVTLHFAEIFHTARGKRVFDVAVEGTPALQKLDIFAEVGKNKPLKKQILGVGVTDGSLEISFQGVIDNAKISAIEIARLAPTGSSGSSGSGGTDTGGTEPGDTGETDEQPISSPVHLMRINSGSASDFTDSAGNVWSRDRYAQSGSSYATGSAIAATSDDALYQSERYDSELRYKLPVPDGTYDLVLHFAEVYQDAKGKRVFDVSAENKLLIDNLDIYAQVGKNTALKKVLTGIEVSDGAIDLLLKASVNTAKLSGIEVIATTGAPSAGTGVAETYLGINVGGDDHVDDEGTLWAKDTFYLSGSTYRSSAAVAGTTADELFQTERYGKTLSYRIPVENGTYDVVLGFAEVYYSGPGKRVFDVTVEGTLAVNDLDIYKEVGKNTALKRTLSGVTVTDGYLDLDLQASVDNAKLSMIELRTR